MAPLVIVGAKALTSERLDRHASAIKRLARVENIEHASVAPRGSAQIVVGEATACLPLGSLIDLGAEKLRLEKAIAKVDVERERILGKLANENSSPMPSLNWSRPSASGWSNSTCKETRSALLCPAFRKRAEASSPRQVRGEMESAAAMPRIF